MISADPSFNRYIVQQEGKMVEMWYLDTFSKLFAQEGEARTTAAGLVHKYLRTLTLTHFGSESLKQKLLPHLQNLVQKTLHGWSSQDSIDVKQAALTVSTFPRFEIRIPFYAYIYTVRVRMFDLAENIFHDKNMFNYLV